MGLGGEMLGGTRGAEPGSDAVALASHDTNHAGMPLGWRVPDAGRQGPILRAVARSIPRTPDPARRHPARDAGHNGRRDGPRGA